MYLSIDMAATAATTSAAATDLIFFNIFREPGRRRRSYH
jgi:hypothetical protein